MAVCKVYTTKFDLRSLDCLALSVHVCLLLSWTWTPVCSHGISVDAASDSTADSLLSPTTGAEPRLSLCPHCSAAELPRVSNKENAEEQERAEMERLLRLEMIKDKILQQLKLASAPEVSASVSNLPDPIRQAVTLSRDGADWGLLPDDVNQEVDQADDIPQPRQVTLVAKRAVDCPSGSYNTCLTFHFDPSLSQHWVTSSRLWLYFRRSQAASANRHDTGDRVIKRVEVKHARGKITLLVKDIPTAEGWAQIEIKRAVRHELHRSSADGEHNIGPVDVKVVCRACSSGSNGTASVAHVPNLRPFLVVTMYSAGDVRHGHLGGTRRRRHAERGIRSARGSSASSGPNECCARQSLVLNFTEINWHFVVRPKTIDAGYCHGSCSQAECLSTTNSSVRDIFNRLDRRRSSNGRPFFNRCCTPVTKAAQSIIHVGNNGSYMTSYVSDLIVADCGCPF